ncbi:MAG TPA: diguanylate cyclase [Spirochaetota bacterium]|nr:diguanylate cyclase [Spirochaetota bacterium]
MIDFLDMRSIILGNSLTDIVIILIMFLVWRKYREKFKGLGCWFIACILQVTGQILLLFQGSINDFISVLLANLLIISAGLMLFYGMEIFTSARGRHGMFFLLLIPVIPLYYYFTFVTPLLNVRILIFSVSAIFISLNFIHLLNVRIDKKHRYLYRQIVVVFIILAVVYAARIIFRTGSIDQVSLAGMNLPDKLLILTILMLFILLVFSLVIVINSRLLHDISEYLSERERLVQEFKRMATTDSLTGIYNRMKLEPIMTAEVLRSRRYGRMLSVLLVDIDHFKLVNDNHGHNIGDSVLRDVAAVLKENLREADSLGRWGGEEFLVVAPETSTEGARKIAEKLREAVAAHKFIRDIKVTISVGVASLMADEWEEDMVRRADEAMYMAKNSGRNRIV